MSWKEREAVYDKFRKNEIDTIWATAFNFIVWGGLSLVWSCYALWIVTGFLEGFISNTLLLFIIGTPAFAIVTVLPVVLFPTRITEAVAELPYKPIQRINDKRESLNHELWIALGLNEEE